MFTESHAENYSQADFVYNRRSPCYTLHNANSLKHFEGSLLEVSCSTDFFPQLAIHLLLCVFNHHIKASHWCCRTTFILSNSGHLRDCTCKALYFECFRPSVWVFLPRWYLIECSITFPLCSTFPKRFLNHYFYISGFFWKETSHEDLPVMWRERETFVKSPAMINGGGLEPRPRHRPRALGLKRLPRLAGWHIVIVLMRSWAEPPHSAPCK